MTLQDALVAYKTYSRAEGKSPRTIRWITSSVGYFADFLGPECQDIAGITGNDLRRFIIALQGKHKFSNHPYNKPQSARLHPSLLKPMLGQYAPSLVTFITRDSWRLPPWRR